MKKFFALLVFILPVAFYSQVGYVETENKIYDFLERLNENGLLENYDSFEKPKTRREIAARLIELNNKRDLLNPIDKRKLDYFLAEFEYEIKGTTDGYSSLFGNSIGYLINDKPKFLFFSTDTSVGSVFVNFLGGAESIYKSEIKNGAFALPYIFGGKIRLTFGKHFGAMIKATNGSFFGEKEVLMDEKPFKYNYKFTETSSDNIGSKYFDETAGYFTVQTKYVDFKIGRDRMNLGYGIYKTLVGNNAPRFDYLSMNLRYKNFRFSYFHGKVLGNILREQSHDIDGNPTSFIFVNDKWVAYHRFAFNVSGGTQFGAGETVVYYGRAVDLSYLNPFNFYKSAEHANQDRDNSMLFFDFKTVDLIKRVGISLAFMIDDIDFSKLGTGWYGNKFLWDFGLNYSPQILPADIFRLQLVRIEPYVYSHKYYDNNFTHYGYNIADNFQPNSLNIILRYDFSLTGNLDFSFSYLYQKHGANKVDEDGNVVTNYGGDILVGHRHNDAEYLNFLDGIKETLNYAELKFRYEFIRNYDLLGKIIYSEDKETSAYGFYLGVKAKL